MLELIADVPNIARTAKSTAELFTVSLLELR